MGIFLRRFPEACPRSRSKKMDVDLNKLKTFYILGRVKSYTGCAEKLCLTQSAVSHAIKKLESDLGFDLVDRKSRNFKLTPKGEFIFQRSCTIFNQIDDTFDQLARSKNLPVTLALGAPVEFGSSVLIKGMAPFLDQRPHIHMDFVLDTFLLQGLLSDDLDIIVDCTPHIHEDLVTIPLFWEEYVVIASTDYIKNQKLETIRDLNRCNLLSFDRDLSWWKNFINALTEDAGFGCAGITRISNIRGIINGAVESLGVGFVPRYAVLKELERGSLVELFPETEVHNDQISIYLKKHNYEKQVFRDLIAHIKSLTLH